MLISAYETEGSSLTVTTSSFCRETARNRPQDTDFPFSPIQSNGVYKFYSGQTIFFLNRKTINLWCLYLRE